ncbi:MAG: hypothetical protein QGG50_02520 [Methanopyri archaeon]|nr:hypothetical protein [Methanopyri archaeon]
MSNKISGIIAVVVVMILFMTSPGADQIIPFGSGSIEAMVMLLVMGVAVIYIMEDHS